MSMNPEDAAALAELDEADRQRFLADFDRWVITIEHHTMASERGYRVAPKYRRPAAEQLSTEATRREALGDVTARAWAILAEDWAG